MSSFKLIDDTFQMHRNVPKFLKGSSESISKISLRLKTNSSKLHVLSSVPTDAESPGFLGVAPEGSAVTVTGRARFTLNVGEVPHDVTATRQKNQGVKNHFGGSLTSISPTGVHSC